MISNLSLGVTNEAKEKLAELGYHPDIRCKTTTPCDSRTARR